MDPGPPQLHPEARKLQRSTLAPESPIFRSLRSHKAFEMGDPNVTLPEVMIAKSKAGLAFEGMVQVRNKMIDAYQEIMRMQV